MHWLLSLLTSILLATNPVDSEIHNDWKLYFFVSEKCPICQYYTSKIQQIGEDYKEYEIVLVFPNQLSTEETSVAFLEKYELTCDIVIDSNHALVNKFDAMVTPEVVLYNVSNDSVYYQGRIDDNYYRVGKRRTKVRSNDLIDALDATKNNTPIANRRTDAIGCYISKPSGL